MARTYDVFISYSSADRPLAEAIHAGLSRAEVTVWRDRERLVPGLRFTEKIFDAIRHSTLCLCLLSQDYLDSGYANQEAGAAHGMGIRLFPVRVGSVGYDQLVGLMRDEHVPAFGLDFPDVADLVHAVSVEIVGIRRGVRGSAAPALPPHYVARTELRELVNRVVVGHSTPWHAIVGRPGSGRTTLAAALAAAIAPSVDERVYWVERQDGFQPHGLPVHLQSQLLAQLTDAPPSIHAWQEGRRLLRRYSSALPRSARCVLFVDDADAEPEILSSLDIDASWSVIAIGQDAGAFSDKVPPSCMQKLDGLSPEEALELVGKVISAPPEAIGDDARELIERLDRLPGALTVAAMLVRGSVRPAETWRDLLEALTEGAIDELSHPARPQAGVAALLQAAVHRLRREEINALVSLSVLPDGSTVDIPLLQRVSAAKQERRTRAIASRLRELSLLEETSAGLRTPSLIRSFLRQRHNFGSHYIRVLAEIHPGIHPLVAAILWDDRDVFERLLASQRRPRRRETDGARQDKSPPGIEAYHEGFHALHVAAQYGRSRMVARMLAAGVPVDIASSPTHQTPLHFAIYSHRPSIAGLLVGAGADPSHPDRDGYTPLHMAAQADDGPTTALLLERGGDASAANRLGNQPMHIASFHGSAAVAAVLARWNANLIASTGENGNSPLIMAARRGHTQVVEVLLKAGALPNEPNPSGLTPLHLAALGGHDEVVDTLLGAGAVVNQAVDGVTALYLAAQEGRTTIVSRLLRGGADPSGGRHTETGSTATHMAALLGFEDILRLLVEAGAPVVTPDGQGYTPLHYAARHSRLSATAAFTVSTDETGVRFGAATTMATFSSSAVVEFLLRAGAPVNARSETGDTALHLAATSGGVEAIHALLSAGADARLANLQGMTAVDAARSAGRDPIAGLLDSASAPSPPEAFS